VPELEPLVDVPSLRRYLDRTLPGDDGVELEVERHLAGHSNETFFLRRGAERFVLRRPPRGAFLPTAHDVVREFRVLSALDGTPVRTPRPVLLCEEPEVIGAPFYLMEHVDGVVIRTDLPHAFADDVPARKGIGEELVDALAELHAVDWRAVGLEGFGRPDRYLARQVRRWKGQLALTEPLTRVVQDLHLVSAWLDSNLPQPGLATLVHGDYKLDNVTFDLSAPPHLTAILDWEMSTLGDPLADLGWMLSFWREPGDPAVLELEVNAPTAAGGFSTRRELVERYAERSGRAVGDLTFYLVLAVWKLAILLEGSYARHLAGLTDDPFFAAMEHVVPALAARAVALTEDLAAT
jgi:aminoglycoside phosphotransferase (APT) family kinase protein